MKRRTALQGLIAAGVVPSAPIAALANAGKAAGEKASLTLANILSLKDRFAAALTRLPYLLGYKSVEQSDYHAPDAETDGAWPKELSGTLYRNGPARHEIGEFRYQHWFDGDGMVQSYHIKDQKVEHRARMVRTRKYVDEQKAGRALYPGFGTLPPNSRGTTSADQINVANISVLAHHDRVFALWEAGSPYEIDGNNLNTLGEHEFSPEMSGMPFSAHPRVEPDGVLWNFGYASGAKKLVLWHLDAAGQVVKAGLVDCDPISMVHDFVVTKSHIVLLVCPLHYDDDPQQEANNFLDTHRWYPERATQVIVVKKNDFSKVQRLELPAQWVFHFSNAWEDNAGVIRFEASRSNDPSVLDGTFRDIMAGTITPSAPSHLYRYRIDTKRGRASEELIRGNGSCEFPVISPQQVGRKHTQLLVMSEAQAPYPGLNQVTLIDPDQGKESSYRYADHLMPEEHLLVGAPNAAGEMPWVLGSALNIKRARTELFLYPANALADGPVASAALPYALPLGLHGKFVST